MAHVTNNDQNTNNDPHSQKNKKTNTNSSNSNPEFEKIFDEINIDDIQIDINEKTTPTPSPSEGSPTKGIAAKELEGGDTTKKPNTNIKDAGHMIDGIGDISAYIATQKQSGSTKKVKQSKDGNTNDSIDQLQTSYNFDALDGTDIRTLKNIYAIIPHARGEHKLVWLQDQQPEQLRKDDKGRTAGTEYIKNGTKIYDVHVDFHRHATLENQNGNRFDVWLLEHPGDEKTQLLAIKAGLGGGKNFGEPILIKKQTTPEEKKKPENKKKKTPIAKKEKVVKKQEKTSASKQPTPSTSKEIQHSDKKISKKKTAEKNSSTTPKKSKQEKKPNKDIIKKDQEKKPTNDLIKPPRKTQSPDSSDAINIDEMIVNNETEDKDSTKKRSNETKETRKETTIEHPIEKESRTNTPIERSIQTPTPTITDNQDTINIDDIIIDDETEDKDSTKKRPNETKETRKETTIEHPIEKESRTNTPIERSIQTPTPTIADSQETINIDDIIIDDETENKDTTKKRPNEAKETRKDHLAERSAEKTKKQPTPKKKKKRVSADISRKQDTPSKIDETQKQEESIESNANTKKRLILGLKIFMGLITLLGAILIYNIMFSNSTDTNNIDQSPIRQEEPTVIGGENAQNPTPNYDNEIILPEPEDGTDVPTQSPDIETQPDSSASGSQIEEPDEVPQAYRDGLVTKLNAQRSESRTLLNKAKLINNAEALRYAVAAYTRTTETLAQLEEDETSITADQLDKAVTRISLYIKSTRDLME